MERIRKKVVRQYGYVTEGVWNDEKNNWKISTIKVLNLSVRSFLSSDLQSKACAMTYRTLLAVVPALALVCAIGRGFGLQDAIMQQLIQHLPSQQQLLRTAFSFVDSYLSQASGGIFVGVGIIFLIWTVVSLIRNIELTFNDIWQVNKSRSIWRMSTDYLAIIIILPILLIMANGITIFMSTSLVKLLPFGFVKPTVEFLFDGLGLVLIWLFFAGTYMLVPNTKVKFKTAIIPGIIVGTACQILQWLFLSGQIYVAKYNAIYGSFSFLPLFLIWMQLVWLFTLTGAVLCYAIQNIGEYNYGDNIKGISYTYRTKTTIAILTIIIKRFIAGLPSLTISEIALKYKLPVNLVTPEIMRLHEMKLINFVDTPGKEINERPLQPSKDLSKMTVGQLLTAISDYGSSDFIPTFDKTFNSINNVLNGIDLQIKDCKVMDMSLSSLEIELQPQQ
ncbi:MAG: YihY/virulence factor BrkB family protein [Bacteroides sp.]|nr:YihY/virulence factor BrkB family protein [Bacteroides sp.]